MLYHVGKTRGFDWVYSSGSVAAQKLLFQYSDAGNLDVLFDANFDTTVGHKREKESYLEIARQLVPRR